LETEEGNNTGGQGQRSSPTELGDLKPDAQFLGSCAEGLEPGPGRLGHGRFLQVFQELLPSFFGELGGGFASRNGRGVCQDSFSNQAHGGFHPPAEGGQGRIGFHGLADRGDFLGIEFAQQQGGDTLFQLFAAGRVVVLLFHNLTPMFSSSEARCLRAWWRM
jgi:hypothetical protein